MKKLIAVVFFCAITANLFSQTYKLETVFSDNLSDKTYLSHWKLLEETDYIQSDLFSFWGYQNYFDSRDDGSYEVEYFKGTAKDMYQFLKQINEFSEKHKDENNILTHISNVQVKISSDFGFKQTLVYDKDGKVACKYRLKQWNEILAKFILYCDNQKIIYQ